ncbi:flagellar basal body rod protein FlgG [Sporosarcina sp. P17b]|uniref:flagellar basal body rod protein FlgG n=1 Tax=Sporosarcina sp. P17b TaxID=2048260 RepID=UPI000C1656F9|nr:flagellar basal body rod protein FlgG [Sporosarcina sp. P17b]PIC75212.1 flagellar basal body rod protein FlgG [Sporosarcina sp. P17b]
MLRSMYSGISGLKNFQTKLDVIGNNIANVNTYGFKKGRVVFKDLYSQQVSLAGAPGTARGGVNPKQVGLGSQLGAIDTIHAPGSAQFTGNTLDLAIEGDGLFIVGDPDGGERFYTRAGNFYLDAGAGDTDESANLVDGEGRFVLNSSGEKIIIPLSATSLSVSQDGIVSYVSKDDDGNNVLDTAGTIGIAKFNNPGGLEKVGGNLYKESANSGAPSVDVPLSEGGHGAVKSGSLEMSNVDLSEEFTEMIVAQRGFQANTRIITTSDEILQELVNLKR